MNAKLFSERLGFFNGMASCLDLGATMFRQNRTGQSTREDFHALSSDGQAVAGDMRRALDLYRKGTHDRPFTGL